jgi:hypothetical protein
MTDDRTRNPRSSTIGHRPSVLEKRLLILWFAVAFVVWNGVYDMRMRDAALRYLVETANAQAGLGRGVDLRAVMHRGLVDAIAFSTAWALGVLLAGLATIHVFRLKAEATKP